MSEVVDLLKDVSGKRKFFRGQADGSWKIFSSMQREWILKELNHQYKSYEELVEKFLTFSKEYAIQKLNNVCNGKSDIGVFSALQHYGAPTPFVDWTSDYRIALYFASLTMADCVGKETSSFVSVYWLEVGDGAATPYNDLTSYAEMKSQYSLNFEANDVFDEKSKKDVVARVDEYNRWKENCLWMERSKDFLDIFNPRINLQEGAFFYSPFESLSLDKIFCKEAESMDDDNEQTLMTEDSDLHSVESFTKVPQNFNNTKKQESFPKIHCLDIHKSLIPRIQRYLCEHEINKETLGLNNQDWGVELFNKFLACEV